MTTTFTFIRVQTCNSHSETVVLILDFFLLMLRTRCSIVWAVKALSDTRVY
jgi:hypothetical protein